MLKILPKVLIILGISLLFIFYPLQANSSYQTSWIGNSFGGGDKWVQQNISSLYVTAQGKCFTNSIWDEAGREVGIYQDGDVIGKAEALHGWGRNGGIAITVSKKYIYVAMKQSHSGLFWQDYPPKETTWYAVRRYHLNGTPAPFSGGRGYDKSMLVISNQHPVTGLAVNDEALYISNQGENKVSIYDTKTMKQKGGFAIASPESLTIDQKNNIWLIQASDNQEGYKIAYYSPVGEFLAKEITEIERPTAIAMDNQGRLLITENGIGQQVLIYDVTTDSPVLIDSLGIRGGIYSENPGEIKPDKLYGLTGVGVDSQNNIYVSLDGFAHAGTHLRQYSPQKVLNWELVGLEFLDSADVDTSSDGLDVYTKEEHFQMNYEQKVGKQWQYKAYTVDYFNYPQDGRLHTRVASPFFRRIQNDKFLFLTDMYAERLLIYRFEKEIAIPCGIFARAKSNWPENQPLDSRWLWRDLNGDGDFQAEEYETLGKQDTTIWGWEVDSGGNIWQASGNNVIWRYYFQGLDEYGCPVYLGDKKEEFNIPEPLTRLERIKYFPETDVLYLGGFTKEHPSTDDDWGIVGTEIIRYDSWHTQPQLRWRIALPYNFKVDPILIIKAMDIAGDRVFTVSSREAKVYVYDSDTGELINELSPGKEVHFETGWVDIPYGIRAYRRNNGEYLVFVEEDAKAKVIFYNLK